jgi:hypothetical protein
MFRENRRAMAATAEIERLALRQHKEGMGRSGSAPAAFPSDRAGVNVERLDVLVFSRPGVGFVKSKVPI